MHIRKTRLKNATDKYQKGTFIINGKRRNGTLMKEIQSNLKGIEDTHEQKGTTQILKRNFVV